MSLQLLGLRTLHHKVVLHDCCPLVGRCNFFVTLGMCSNTEVIKECRVKLLISIQGVLVKGFESWCWAWFGMHGLTIVPC